MSLDRLSVARGFVAMQEKAGAKRAIIELAALLLEHRMHSQIDEILADISQEYTRVYGVVEDHARSPFPLSEELKETLSMRVKKSTGAKRVILHEELDTTLLGGVIMSAPDMELDLSLRSKLEKLKA